MTTHKSFSARADIEAILAGRDAARLDVPVLQPADPFLDTAGEDLRRRIFLTQSESGEAMCLRPEFTIPVCLHHVGQENGHTRYCYVGTVFRQRRSGAAEFLQAGIEDIGDKNEAGADARSLADAVACLDALGASQSGNVVMGDQTIFDAVLVALGLPTGWRVRLAQAFGNDATLESALTRLAEPPAMPDLPDAMLAAAQSGDEAKLEMLANEALEQAGLAGSGGRQAVHITRRLLSKVADARSTPDPEKIEILRSFLVLDTALADAVAVLRDFASQNNLAIGQAVDAFEKRATALSAHDLGARKVTYQASFGRALDYYTGFVYEIRSADGTVLAGGGRYDKLLSLLGATSNIKGVGFSLWLDRIAETSS